MISTVAPHQDMDITLFVGGASCGKSRLAEACAEGLAAQRLYIATMRPQDAEARHKVARHRARRQGWGQVLVDAKKRNRFRALCTSASCCTSMRPVGRWRRP